jgi:hypothetical protein
MELSGKNQFLAYADDINILGIKSTLRGYEVSGMIL